MYAIRSYYGSCGSGMYLGDQLVIDDDGFRITSYNVCYTKLLRNFDGSFQGGQFIIDFLQLILFN